MEATLVPKAGFDFRTIDITGFQRSFAPSEIIYNLKTLKKLLFVTGQCKKIIKEFKPDVAVGFGGYVSGPVIRTAHKMGVKTAIHEQNAFPGVTNKMLEKHVKKVFLGFEEAEKYFKHPEKHVVTGNPVRADFFNFDRNESRKKLGLSDDDFMLLSFGGSQGAGRINRAMIDVVRKYNGEKNMQVYFATGKAYYEPVMTEINDLGFNLAPNIHIMEYIRNMQVYLAAADLVVARSGALTVSEIAICGRPSILVPSPNVTGDHQTFNARAIADKGGAVLLPESELDGERLFEEIERLSKDRQALEVMSEKAKESAPMDATDIIYYSLIT
jgi:UDP-N-acetylglucosamine--N-acetylmuramyl-(pentapeptide) pyrophosphoryl-undecaprenol N-acetylglucosamine transferase